jgi:hypothetical protein
MGAITTHPSVLILLIQAFVMYFPILLLLAIFPVLDVARCHDDKLPSCSDAYGDIHVRYLFGNWHVTWVFQAGL